MDQKKRTEIASLGQFGLIDLLTSGFTPKNASTLKGAGDDAAVIAPGRGEAVLCTTDSFYEGVDFDLTYFPLKHLGYKAVTAGVSDILAMNALPAQITVSLGVSSKLPVEALQDLYEGIAFACKEQEIDLVGGDTRASMTGLVITVTTLGYAKKEKIVYRSGAQQNDLVCITGNLGAAYMGLQLLEREKRVLADVENPEPQFKGYEYLLEKYLKPRPRTDIVRALAEEKIRPTSMIDLSDGLASDLMQICKSSACGARILSNHLDERKMASAQIEGPAIRQADDRAAFAETVRRALYAGKIIAYAQGFSLMQDASERYGWNLDLGTIASIFRAGCIIQAVFLDDITKAYEADSNAGNLMFHPFFRSRINEYQDSLRRAASTGVLNGLPVPALSQAASYLDAFRSPASGANLIQAQRDCFGAHTYERNDRPGSFHHEWRITDDN